MGRERRVAGPGGLLIIIVIVIIIIVIIIIKVAVAEPPSIREAVVTGEWDPWNEWVSCR